MVPPTGQGQGREREQPARGREHEVEEEEEAPVPAERLVRLFEESLQAPSETLAEFMARVQLLAEAAFADEPEEMRRRRVLWRFIAGLWDHDLAERLKERHWREHRPSGEPVTPAELLNMATNTLRDRPPLAGGIFRVWTPEQVYNHRATQGAHRARVRLGLAPPLPPIPGEALERLREAAGAGAAQRPPPGSAACAAAQPRIGELVLPHHSRAAAPPTASASTPAASREPSARAGISADPDGCQVTSTTALDCGTVPRPAGPSAPHRFGAESQYETITVTGTSEASQPVGAAADAEREIDVTGSASSVHHAADLQAARQQQQQQQAQALPRQQPPCGPAVEDETSQHPWTSDMFPTRGHVARTAVGPASGSLIDSAIAQHVLEQREEEQRRLARASGERSGSGRAARPPSPDVRSRSPIQRHDSLRVEHPSPELDELSPLSRRWRERAEKVVIPCPLDFSFFSRACRKPEGISDPAGAPGPSTETSTLTAQSPQMTPSVPESERSLPPTQEQSAPQNPGSGASLPNEARSRSVSTPDDPNLNRGRSNLSGGAQGSSASVRSQSCGASSHHEPLSVHIARRNRDLFGPPPAHTRSLPSPANPLSLIDRVTTLPPLMQFPDIRRLCREPTLHICSPNPRNLVLREMVQQQQQQDGPAPTAPAPTTSQAAPPPPQEPRPTTPPAPIGPPPLTPSRGSYSDFNSTNPAPSRPSPLLQSLGSPLLQSLGLSPRGRGAGQPPVGRTQEVAGQVGQPTPHAPSSSARPAPPPPEPPAPPPEHPAPVQRPPETAPTPTQETAPVERGAEARGAPLGDSETSSHSRHRRLTRSERNRRRERRLAREEKLRRIAGNGSGRQRSTSAPAAEPDAWSDYRPAHNSD